MTPRDEWTRADREASRGRSFRALTFALAALGLTFYVYLFLLLATVL